MANAYYQNKRQTLCDLFGTQDLEVSDSFLKVSGRTYPIVDDVIVLADEEEYTDLVRTRLGKVKVSPSSSATTDSDIFAADIQYSFGHEWTEYHEILPEHSKEFNEYFDLVDVTKLAESRVCDLGCGIGRWSYFLADKCREIVLVDFSDSIFSARKNLRDKPNALFFMCNIKKVPFRPDFCDFLFCIGVLHHLPTRCLDEVRSLRRYAPELLIYLYYSCDNRPLYYSSLLRGVTFVRSRLSQIRSTQARTVISKFLAAGVYVPLVALGKGLDWFGQGKWVPLYDGYKDKSFGRIEQDVYDRFFTRIEQRVSKKQIMELKDVFSEVQVSEGLPYWHFLCVR